LFVCLNITLLLKFLFYLIPFQENIKKYSGGFLFVCLFEYYIITQVSFLFDSISREI